ncbi:MAG TPA: DUF222 domain-containing protein [Cryptosporangiaceae bacterium]|nr:DUF222 domain-containing protein [Cryptosporangiaceae bacterium]
MSEADLIDCIVGFERVASWAQARQARLLAEFARRRPHDDPLARQSETTSRFSEFAADEVGLALRLSRTSATARLTLASTLVEELPGTLAEWERGSLDGPKVRAIAEAAYVLPGDRCAALEARVLPGAPEQTAGQLRSAVGRAVLSLDPDGAHARHQHRRQDRRVVIATEGDGMSSLWALLPAAEAAAAYERLGQLARGLGADDPRGMDARRADLFVQLLTGSRCGAATAVTTPPDRVAPSSERGSDAGGGHDCRPAGPGKPLVHVVVPITMLMGLDETPGELVGYGPIPAPQAREIAAEGTWRRLLTDPASGTLLDHGRRTYSPPVGLADFVRGRDVYCRFPTCRQPARRADLDHAVPYADGGDTSAGNLHASCRHHHRGKTRAAGWRVRQHDDGQLTYTTRTGHSYRSSPHDYRIDSSSDRRPAPTTDVAPRPGTSTHKLLASTRRPLHTETVGPRIGACPLPPRVRDARSTRWRRSTTTVEERRAMAVPSRCVDAGDPSNSQGGPSNSQSGPLNSQGGDPAAA